MLLGAATVANAQTEAGVARDARTHKPIACLHVALVDSADRPLVHTVTDTAGRFMLEAPHPGRYRVRFETFGWAPLGGPIDTLEDGAFKQRAYPIAFSDLLVPVLPIDDRMVKSLPSDTKLDRSAIDSLFSSRRRASQAKRDLERASAWKSRMLDAGSTQLPYPEAQFADRHEGAVVARFILDASGRARPESWTVIDASHEDFVASARKLLDARWTPSTNAGRPVCDVVQVLMRFGLETRDPYTVVPHVTLENE